jgi:hypothetical protein
LADKRARGIPAEIDYFASGIDTVEDDLEVVGHDEADDGSLGRAAWRDRCLNRQGLAAHELQNAGARHYSSWDLGLGVWDLGFIPRFLSSEAYASAAARDPRIHPMTIPINSMPGM